MALRKLNFIKNDWLLFSVMVLLVAWAAVLVVSTPYAACADPQVPSSAGCNNQASSACSLCTNETADFQTSGSVLGGYMIDQMFKIINTILLKVESTFYNGIISSTVFQQTINVAFLLYISVYGIMIIFNLASFRTNEVSSRLVKLAIVYALTSPNGWTMFSNIIEKPVINEINDLITTMANAGSGSGGRCASTGQFSGAGPIAMSGGSTSTNLSIQLSTGPMAMLYGPMTCVFAAQFIANIQALVTSASYGWLVAMAAVWGLLEFSKMILGALVTYVKAIVGLTVLFGIAPIFMAFFLFEKTRSLTQGWIGMVFGFALQPVMLFAFLAFYATIIGGALTNMTSDASGNPVDVCYVPWYTMPRLFDVYWMKFKNSAGAAGGQTFITSGAGSGSGAAGDAQLPVQILNVLYFVVLCNLGKNFCEYINELSDSITGSSGAGVVTGDRAGQWLSANAKTLKKDLFTGAGGAKKSSNSSVPGNKPSTTRSQAGGQVG